MSAGVNKGVCFCRERQQSPDWKSGSPRQLPAALVPPGSLCPEKAAGRSFSPAQLVHSSSGLPESLPHSLPSAER